LRGHFLDAGKVKRFDTVIYAIISVFSACGGISILEVLLPTKACLIITIFAWDTWWLRLLCLRFAPCKRCKLFLFLM
jgi:hypothetical protein